MLTPWKENYDQPRQHIEKQRYYFANKYITCIVHFISILVTSAPPQSSQGMVFPVVMYGCESWTVKKAEH